MHRILLNLNLGFIFLTPFVKSTDPPSAKVIPAMSHSTITYYEVEEAFEHLFNFFCNHNVTYNGEPQINHGIVFTRDSATFGGDTGASRVAAEETVAFVIGNQYALEGASFGVTKVTMGGMT